jgi:hypothetical protein
MQEADSGQTRHGHREDCNPHALHLAPAITEEP